MLSAQSFVSDGCLLSCDYNIGKGKFILQDGTVTINILNSATPQVLADWSKGLRLRGKAIAKYVKIASKVNKKQKFQS